MQAAQEICQRLTFTNNSSMQPQQSNQQSSLTKRADLVFAKLTIIYSIFRKQITVAGNQAASELKTKALKDEWEKTLVGFSRKEVEIALEKCKTRFDYPPTMKQFYDVSVATSVGILHIQ
ncbi:hypothetical protein Psal006b_03499 (plasmid) [Piscirickettsia salmonis]|uniref:hypothetical protein n=1 Tax=Piscirickettsia salmonis TaxID=1238 RepID=UPI0004846E9B|nr:hypothetical protein [Piscirickettsia salmonis]AKP74214.1 hypothetical protein PSLF89_2564 [Piscirickettsia salmonis LF-89 = ATCC VR-1361]ALY03040.1 hypothetical protein AWE47_09450 [Piscirickettsia salmonis]AMA42598.1 hypothetical protein AWJ11_09655 [Piscirickettsia salmonis]AOS35068.1 hypothetical protein AVM72_06795 [Piscirickettsia salmonis]APS59777.1 hypothetical protein AVI53_03730 [Piscirickettsia salmonis]